MQTLGLNSGRKRPPEICPVPAKTLWLVRGWERGRCYKSPIALLNETLAEHGREAYDALCEEILYVLRKRFGTERETNFHVVVRPGFSFAPYPAIRPGADSIQLEGDAIIHPLPREAKSE